MSNNTNRPRGLGNFNGMPNARDGMATTGRADNASQPNPPYDPQHGFWQSYKRGSDGSDRFAAQSDAWGMPARTTSGAASPNKPRHAHTASSSFFDSSSLGLQSRSYALSKGYRDEEKENNGLGAGYPLDGAGSFGGHERRASHAQDLQSFGGLGAVGAPPSRDGSNPPSRHSDGSSHHSSPPGITATYSAVPNVTYPSRRPDPLNPSASERHRPHASFDLTRAAATEPVNLDVFTPTIPTMPTTQRTHAPWPIPVYPVAPLYGRDGPATVASLTPPSTRVRTEGANTPFTQQRNMMPTYGMGRNTPIGNYMPDQQQPYYGHQFSTPPQFHEHFLIYNAMLNNPGMAHYQPQPQTMVSGHDADKGSMSHALMEFRANKGARWELKSIYGHIVEFSGDQQGSRFIQKALETANSEEKEKVLQEVLPNAIQMMKDLFGNYVIQKLFEHGNMMQKKVLATQMQGKVPDLSNQMYACRVVQKAFEHVLVEQQAQLVAELEPVALQVIQDQNGNHVIQKVLATVDPSLTGFIYEAVAGQVARLSNNSYGCRVVQRLLECGNPQQKESILREIMASANSMLTDPYGNYVIQHVIVNAQRQHSVRMIQAVLGCNVFTLSRHKHASNIIEECIKHGTAADRSAILKQLTDSSNDGNPLLTLMKDQFANYVLQKLLLKGLSEGRERQKLVDDMNVHFPTLRATLTGRHAQITQRLVDATNGIQSQQQRSRDGVSSAKNTSRRSSTLQVDVNSSTPTPVLTMEQNSPQSSSPPSTNSSALGDSGIAGVAEDGPKGLLRSLRGFSLQDNDHDDGIVNGNDAADRY